MQELYLVSMTLVVLVGVILALTGAGGAIIAVPLLVFGLHLMVAVKTASDCPVCCKQHQPLAEQCFH